MTDRLRAAAEAALEALELSYMNGSAGLHKFELNEIGGAIEQLRTALAEQQETEPVAWYLPSDEGYDSMFRDHRTVVACTGNQWTGWLPLYAAPPCREWQSLTDEEIASLSDNVQFGSRMAKLARIIESALKEKNT